ncbi:MAG TPA: DUF58 domain-containing protein [Gemmatimonadaceae bacterium]|nr:DUF58 domain-containing protein [Gemmatimonadaceae bacterium]
MTDPRASRPDLMDPALVAGLGSLELIARRIVDGFMQGLHRSPRKGFSVEFAEHRQYQPGDDLRYIDWKVLARSDRWMMKLNNEDTNLRATIVLDVSKSMDWTGAPGRLTKAQYAERLAAAVAFLLLHQRDAVGLIRFDDQVRSVVPPRARSVHWHRIVAALEEPGSGLGSDAPGGLIRAASQISRPGMVVLISDLLMDPVEVADALKGLAAAGHHLTVLQVMDPAERDLAVTAVEAEFQDPESLQKLAATVPEVRDAYRTAVAETVEEWRSHLSGAAASHEVVMTDEPFGMPLRRAYMNRQILP